MAPPGSDVESSLGETASLSLQPHGGRARACTVDRILSRRFRESYPERIREIERLLRAETTPRVALLKHAIAGLLHDARQELSLIRAPTLILAGDSDTLLRVEALRNLARDVPFATFEVIAASGHDLTLEQPTVTATRLSRFFQQ